MRVFTALVLGGFAMYATACDGAAGAAGKDDGATSASGKDVGVSAPGPAGDAKAKDGLAGDSAAETDGGCKDLRHPADGLNEADTCWDPPVHYCSAGWSGGGPDWRCSPDASLCCAFSSGCGPCGWVHLACRPRSGTDPALPPCPDLNETIADPACRVYTDVIQLETDICWDGVVWPGR